VSDDLSVPLSLRKHGNTDNQLDDDCDEAGNKLPVDIGRIILEPVRTNPPDNAEDGPEYDEKPVTDDSLNLPRDLLAKS